jgi:mono/diheme cytochrome c family protein
MLSKRASYKYYGLRFSHKKHADLGVQCVFCHRRAAESTEVVDYLMPEGHGFGSHTSEEEYLDTSPCKACHLYFSEFGQKDEKIKARCDTCHLEYNEQEGAKYKPWPFSSTLKNKHKVHFDKGIPCLRCHVDFDKLEEPVRSYTPKRDLCTECHGKNVQERNADKLLVRTLPATGSELFMDNCAVCHGPGGKGTSKISSFFAAGLTPRDLTDLPYMSKRSNEQLFDVIYYGGPELMLSERMPAWEGLLKEDEVRLLVAYVRSLSASNPAPAE